jgi:hypothetical protein
MIGSRVQRWRGIGARHIGSKIANLEMAGNGRARDALSSPDGQAAGPVIRAMCRLRKVIVCMKGLLAGQTAEAKQGISKG